MVRQPGQDHGWGWMVVLGASLAQTCFGMAGRTMGVYYMLLLDRFHGSATLTAIATGIPMFLWGVLGPIVTSLIGLWSCRTVTVLGTLCMVAGFISAAYVPDIISLCCTFSVLIGIGMAMTYTPCFILVGEYFCDRRALAMGMQSTGSAVGAICGAPLLYMLYMWFGYSGLMMLVAGIATHIFITAALYRPFSSHQRGYRGNFHVTINKETHEKLKTDVQLCAESLDGKPYDSKLNANELKSYSHTSLVISVTNHDQRGSLTGGQSKSENCIKTVMSAGDQITKTDTQSDTGVHDESGLLDYHIETISNSDKAGKSRSENLLSNRNKNLEKNKLGVKALLSSDPLRKSCEQLELVMEPQNKSAIKRKVCDFGLLRDAGFLGMMGMTFTAISAFGVNVTFLPEMAREKGNPLFESTFLLSVMGISDCSLRIPLGFLFDQPVVRKHRTVIYTWVLLICGLSIACLPLTANYPLLVCICLLRGACSGLFLSQRATILGDLVGEERVGQAFGLQLMVTGVGTVTGRLIGGLCRDYLGIYDVAFYISGALVMLSCIIFLFYLYAKKKQTNKQFIEISACT